MKRRKWAGRATVLGVLVLSLACAGVFVYEARRGGGRSYVALGPGAEPTTKKTEPARNTIYLGNDSILLGEAPRIEPEPVAELPGAVELSRIGDELDTSLRSGQAMTKGSAFGGGVSNTGYLQLAFGGAGPLGSLAQLADISHMHPSQGIGGGGGGGGGASAGGSSGGSSDNGLLGQSIQIVGPSRSVWGPLMNPRYRPLGNFPIPEPAGASVLAFGFLLLRRGRRPRPASTFPASPST